MSTPAPALDCCARKEQFPPTQWTVIIAAGSRGSPEAEEALGKLCRAYWFPLYAYARRRGNSPEEAEDLTQEYFARVLSSDLLCGLNREGGRFRSFLLTTFKCFLANQWHYSCAKKRGNGKPLISIDGDAEQRLAGELVTGSTPETEFDREWAFTVLDRALRLLGEEYAAAGKTALFEILRGCLPGAGTEICYRDAANSLLMSETALRMAVHRLRRRYGALLRAEIQTTVASPADLDAELQVLIEAVTYA